MENLLGVLITLAIFAIIGLICYVGITRMGKKALKEVQTKLQHALPAKAKILETNTTKGIIRPARMGSTNVQVLLEIQTNIGRVYQTSVLWEVEQTALLKLQPGTTIEVKIDSDNPQTIYPNEKWAEFKWS